MSSYFYLMISVKIYAEQFLGSPNHQQKECWMKVVFHSHMKQPLLGDVEDSKYVL
jgi:hypothetical protein